MFYKLKETSNSKDSWVDVNHQSWPYICLLYTSYEKFINEMFEKSMPVSFLNDIILLKDNSKLESVRK